MNTCPEVFLRTSEPACDPVQSLVKMRLSVGNGIGKGKVSSIPDVFRGIKFGRIGREKLRMQPWSLLKKRFDGMMTVDHSTIPQQHDRSAEVPEEILQEDLDITMFEAVRAELNIQSNVSPLWRNGDGPKGRDFVLLEPMVNVRCLASWSPRASHIGNEQKPAFIHEYEMGAKSCGFFLSEATRLEPNARWPLHLSGVLGVLVSDNSIPCSVTAARHGSGDSSHGSVSRSARRFAARSINRLNTQLRSDPSTDTCSIVLSVPGSSEVDAQVWVWDGVL